MISFRREKFVPRGGPSGGDGGNGGSIVLSADPHRRTLAWFKGKNIIAARNGTRGGSKKMTGKTGEDRLIPVPVGTMVYEKLEGEKRFLADLGGVRETVVVARGGRGGKGNARYATPTRQTPEIAQPGSPGEERELILELKLIADVGIIGKPNAGKSTLLTTASRARTKIAPYPFTTTEPVLGVVDVGWKRFILAEIPGLIEGAHLGRGLGREFLRHAERTKLLLHLLDGSSSSPVEDLARVNAELHLYSPEMAAKDQIVAVNKIDLPVVRERLAEIREQLKGSNRPVYFISAATGEGVAGLMRDIATRLEALRDKQEPEEMPLRVFRPRPVDISASNPPGGEG